MKISKEENRNNLNMLLSNIEDVKTFKNVCLETQTKPLTLSIDDKGMRNFIDVCMEQARKILIETSEVPFTSGLDIRIAGSTYIDMVEKGRMYLETKDTVEEKTKIRIQELQQSLAVAEAKKVDIAKIDKLRLDLLRLTDLDGYVDYLTGIVETVKNSGVAIDKTNKYIKSLESAKKEIVKRNTLLRYAEFYKNHIAKLRSFVGKAFFDTPCSRKNSDAFVLTDFYGDLQLDYTHFLLYYNMAHITRKNRRIAKGLLYYFAAEQYYRDVKAIKQACARISIKPVYDIGVENFEWRKVPCFSKRFVPISTVPQGYQGYLVEIQGINELAYLLATKTKDISSIGENITKFRGKVKTQKSGFFFRSLKLEQENSLLPYILNLNFALDKLDGKYAKDLLEEFNIRYSKYDGQKDKCNMFKRIIKPLDIVMIGNLLMLFKKRLSLLTSEDIAYIYYVSAERIAIAVRTDVNVEDALGNLTKLVTPIKPITVEDLLMGTYL